MTLPYTRNISFRKKYPIFTMQKFCIQICPIATFFNENLTKGTFLLEVRQDLDFYQKFELLRNLDIPRF